MDGVECDTDSLIRATTIVIPVRDDPALLDCLASIDEAVSVQVVCNGSDQAYVNWVRHHAGPPVTVSTLLEAGIGPAYNQGIAAATTPFVLLMDSDCVFAPGTIRNLVAGLTDAPMSKGRVRFPASHSFGTGLTARARQVLEDPSYTGVVKAYSPPLAYRKSVVSLMGGYHFHSGLKWREDRDFELRRRAAAVRIHYDDGATISHAALTIRADLKSVRSYGVFESIGRRNGWLPTERARTRVAKTLRTLRRIVRQTRSPALVTYFVIRRISFNIGRWEGRLQ